MVRLLLLACGGRAPGPSAPDGLVHLAALRTSGPLPEEKARETVLAQLPTWEACAREHLDASACGTVRFERTAHRHGGYGLRWLEDTLGSEAFTRCLSGALEHVRAPSKAHAATEMTYDVTLTVVGPGGDLAACRDPITPPSFPPAGEAPAPG